MQIRGQVQRVGLQATLNLLWQTPLREWPSRWFFPAAVQHGAGPPPGRRGSRETQEAKVLRISKRVQQLPTEEFMDREEIEALPLHQLKVCSQLCGGLEGNTHIIL